MKLFALAISSAVGLTYNIIYSDFNKVAPQQI